MTVYFSNTIPCHAFMHEQQETGFRKTQLISGTLLTPTLTRFNPHCACIGHAADFTKFSATILNKHNSDKDSPGMYLERYIHTMTPAPHRFHAMSHSCHYSILKNNNRLLVTVSNFLALQL